MGQDQRDALRGRTPRGQRLHAKVPYGHWKTMTFIAALRLDRIDAPCVLARLLNRVRFLAYVSQFLAPTLRPCAEANLFFLPPYSPDFNSIAQVFAKLKTLLRKPPNLGGGNPMPFRVGPRGVRAGRPEVKVRAPRELAKRSGAAGGVFESSA